MDRLLRGCHPAVSFSYFALVIACAMFFMHPLCLALSLLGAGCCAAQLVGAEPFILAMKEGYDSQVGEGGNRLSTGQKQLVSFARAILQSPAIFVLDEATSSVDTETEQLIQRAIQTVLAGRTSFIIAHRLSTIRSADRILVIQDGKIIEDGTHRQLIARQGYYYKLYTNQFQEEQGLDILDGKA